MSFWQQSFGVPATKETENKTTQQHDESDDNLMANDSFWDDDAYDDGAFGEDWGNIQADTFPGGSPVIEEPDVSTQNHEPHVATNEVASEFPNVMQEGVDSPYFPQATASHHDGYHDEAQDFSREEELVESSDTGAIVEYGDGNQPQEEDPAAGILTTTDIVPSPSDGGTAHDWPKETIEGDTGGYLVPQRTNYHSQYDAHHLMLTPSREDRDSQFVFLSDQKAVPSELKRFQEKTRRRRRDMSNQFHKLEIQIAGAASSFAEEKMDLGLAICDTFERACCKPLEEAAERIVMERETVMDRRPAVSSMEKRLSKLSVDMTRHVHVEMNDAKRNELDSFRRDLLQDMIPSMRIEKSMADKIEGGVVRRYETSSGTASKNFHQECAARKAELELFHRHMKRQLQTQEQLSEDILDVIRDLRRQLQMEREERKVADKKLMDDITKTSIAMRRAFLAAFDDSSTN